MRFCAALGLVRRCEQSETRKGKQKRKTESGGKLDHNLELMGIDAHFYSRIYDLFRGILGNFVSIASADSTDFQQESNSRSRQGVF
jgi:hypothetical protein